MAVFEEEWRRITAAMEEGRYGRLTAQLARSAERLKGIALRRAPAEVPTISLTGEIFVRRDALSRPADPQLVMARWTGDYRRGNERTARAHPRNRG